MKEAEWVEQMAAALRRQSWLAKKNLTVKTRLKLSYSCEISSYDSDAKPDQSSFETDLAIIENLREGAWKPRVVVEAKLGRVTTHAAITYSQKAAYHRSVHPYLRYGIMVGNLMRNPLPGRLYRHGAQFDFMISFSGVEPSGPENTRFAELLKSEVAASQALEKILYGTRRRHRDHYTLLQRKLVLK